MAYPDSLDGTVSSLTANDDICRLVEAVDKTKACKICGIKNAEMALLVPGEISLFQSCSKCMAGIIAGLNIRMEIKAHKQCCGCTKTCDNMTVCGRCGNAYYCETSCHIRDWNRHKKECNP